MSTVPLSKLGLVTVRLLISLAIRSLISVTLTLISSSILRSLDSNSAFIGVKSGFHLFSASAIAELMVSWTLALISCLAELIASFTLSVTFCPKLASMTRTQFSPSKRHISTSPSPPTGLNHKSSLDTFSRGGSSGP